MKKNHEIKRYLEYKKEWWTLRRTQKLVQDDVGGIENI